MKIISLKAENFQNLQCVEITPEGHMVQLTGKNGAGKSSVMDAICAALQGADAAKTQPIRQGETRAEIVATTEKWIAKRVFTEKGSRLLLTTPDGSAEFKSPQTLLDAVWGDLSFDPLEFLALKPREQKDLLAKLAGLDLSDLDLKRKALYDERHKANRVAAEREAGVRGLVEVYGPLEPIEEPPSIADLVKASEYLREEIRMREHLNELIRDNAEAMEVAMQALEAAKARIVELEREGLALSEQRRDALGEDTRSLEFLRGELVNVQSELEAADETAKAVAMKRERARELEAAQTSWKDAKSRSEELDQKIKDFDLSRQAQLEAATFPLPGLSLEDGVVLYEGVPLNQVSTGQAIRISFAIAMALNPSLKVIFIRNGSNLDSDGLRLIASLAEERDYQVWVERVDETGTVGIYLEDGTIVERQEVAACATS